MAQLKQEKAYFVKSIGYAETSTGTLRAKTFYLGAVADGERAAQRMADRIMDAWDALKATGATTWTTEALADIKEETKPAAPIVTGREGSPLPIKDIAAQYGDYLDNRAANGQIGENTVVVEKHRIAKVISIVGETLPMNALDDKRLLDAVLAICNRPENKKHEKSLAPAQRMSFTSAREYKKAFKAFLVWAATTSMHGSKKGLVRAPLSFEKTFRDNHPVMLDTLRAAEGEGLP